MANVKTEYFGCRNHASMDNIGNGVKYPASSYTIWFVSAVWRKKTSLLAILVLTVLLVVCLEYNMTKEIVEVTISRQQQQPLETNYDNDSNRQPKRKHSVQFVKDESAAGIETVVDIVGRNRDAELIKLFEEYHQQRRKSSDIGYRIGSTDAAKTPYVPVRRIVHLDLKGAPPKISYLRRLLPFVKNLGATGVLLEWEDMFPWDGNLANLAAKNAYTKKEAKEILKTARKLDLEVIPLVQTFGHLEFALKNGEFMHLREVPESPQALCPSLNASIEFIKDMIDQVMKLHRDVQYLHIGCDEVFNMGECPRCRKKLRDELFLSHVVRVAKYAKKRHSVTSIVWDDMLRHLPTTTLEQYEIGKLVEPMVWVYAEDVLRFVPQTVWEKYETVFTSAWTASAFKGAFGETYYIPNVRRHLDNNMNWLTLMNVEQPKFKEGFRGIAITGWQRYDHFATLCEMLPAAIPSLAVTLIAISHGFANNSLKEPLSRELNCGVTGPSNGYVRDTDMSSEPFLNLNNDPFLWDQYSRCMFPGSQFYRMLYRWHSLQKEIDHYLTTTKIRKAWLTDYNVRRNYTSPLRVDELMLDESRVYHNVLSMVQSMNDALDEVFDRYTIAEWIEQNIYPTVLRLEELQRAAQNLKNVRTWPRRPLPPLVDLLRIGVTVLTNASKESTTTTTTK